MNKLKGKIKIKTNKDSVQQLVERKHDYFRKKDNKLKQIRKLNKENITEKNPAKTQAEMRKILEMRHNNNSSNF